MIRLLLTALALTIGCAGPTAAGDSLASAGDYDAAIAEYEKSASKPRTRVEQTRIYEALAESYRGKLEAELAAVLASSEPAAAKRQRLAELYGLAYSAAESPELGEQIELASIEVSQPELDQVREAIAAGRIGDAMDALFQLFGEVIASEAANQATLAVRSEASAVLRARASSEQVPGVKELLTAWADRLDYAPFSAEAYVSPPIVSAGLEICDQPITLETQGTAVRVHVACLSDLKIREESETYRYDVQQEWVGTQQVCTKEVAGYVTDKKQWVERGKLVTHITSTPYYKSTCREEEYVKMVDVSQIGTRTYPVRVLTARVKGSVVVELPSGDVTMPLDITVSGEVRSLPVASDSSASFFGVDEEEEIAKFKRRVPEKVVIDLKRVVRDAWRGEQLRKAKLAHASGDSNGVRDALARAVLYGEPVPAALGDLGFFSGEQSDQWLHRRDIAMLSVEQITITKRAASANDRFEIGTSFMRWNFTAKHIQMRDLSIQPDRLGAAFEFAMAFSFLSSKWLQARWSPFGFVLYDELAFQLSMGRRISGPTWEYRTGFKASDFEEKWSANGAGASASLLFGHRSRAIGLLAGARGRAMTHRVGGAIAGSAGVPAVLRLEIAPASRHAVFAEFWGFSPVADKKAMGGEVTFAVSGLLNLGFQAEYLNAETRIRGLFKGDVVDLGRRDGFTFGLMLQLAGVGNL